MWLDLPCRVQSPRVLLISLGSVLGLQHYTPPLAHERMFPMEQINNLPKHRLRCAPQRFINLKMCKRSHDRGRAVFCLQSHLYGIFKSNWLFLAQPWQTTNHRLAWDFCKPSEEQLDQCLRLKGSVLQLRRLHQSISLLPNENSQS